jgi:aquaporin Z
MTISAPVAAPVPITLWHRIRGDDRQATSDLTMFERLRDHWPEYLMEASGLALFMLSAASFATLLEYPLSPVRQTLPDALLRRMFMGLAMGSTAIALIYSPIGARSGAHLNPATTLTFYRLRRVHLADALAYILAQFAGGLAGISAAAFALGMRIQVPTVNYVATVPGAWGMWAAFIAEVTITFLLMTVILHVSNHPRWSRFTGLCAGVLVATYITIEAPISGMSMNPARSFGPALLAGDVSALWIYFIAPPLGMLAAAEVFVRTRGIERVFCAKLHHHTAARCIFHCRFGELHP